MERSRRDDLPAVAVLISGNGSNLQALIDATADGSLTARVALVVANRADAHGLERAASAGIPTVVVAPLADEPRAVYDARLAATVAAAQPDVVVLAGWMRILSDAFIQHFPNRIINLHPALPGELPGLHAIDRAWHEMMAGERTRTGVMVHLVPDEGVDDGPVLASEPVEIRLDDSVQSLSARIHTVEHRLLVTTLQRFLTDHPSPLLEPS